MLSKVQHYVPKEEHSPIYFAIFSSHMVYGCQVWGQTRSSQMKRIYKLQNRALRIISFEHFDTDDANPLYKGSKILKLQDVI